MAVIWVIHFFYDVVCILNNFKYNDANPGIPLGRGEVGQNNY